MQFVYKFYHIALIDAIWIFALLSEIKAYSIISPPLYKFLISPHVSDTAVSILWQ